MLNPTSRRRRALIIDDEADICYLLSGILRQKNIQAVFAGSLDETDKILQSSDTFPLIFLDNHLPDGLGLSYVGRLKEKFPGTRVIMITAHDARADKIEAEAGGVDFFIGKPFSRELILQTVDNYLA